MRQFKPRVFAMLLALLLATLLNVWAFASNFVDMPDDWSRPALEAAVDNGLLVGNENGLLNPHASLTRAEMAAVIVRAYGSAEPGDLSSYTDLTSSAWYWDSLAQAVRMEVLTGDGVLMAPGRFVTRQEAAAALARALDLEDGTREDLAAFEDADEVADWAVGPLAAMVKAGYIGGNGDRLEPARIITRAQFAQVMDNTFACYIREPGTVTEIPEGNVIINTDGVTLKDVTVTGDLIIGDGVGSGEAKLDGVTVEGTVIVRGGGENSVYFEDCKLELIKVIKPFEGEGTTPLRLVFLGSTNTTVRIEVLSLNSNVLIDGTVGTISIEGKYAFVKVSGKVDAVFVIGEGVIINNSGTIRDLNAETDVTVTGNGRVENIKGDGSVTDENGNKVRPKPPAPVVTDEPYYPPVVLPTAAPSAEPTPTPHIHSFGDWTVTKEATCVDAGMETRTCTGCGETESQEIAPHGRHSFVWDESKQAAVCEICGAVQDPEQPTSPVGE